MPTGENSAVIPVTRQTKEQLDGIKGGFTFNEILVEAFRVVPPAMLRARLEARRAEQLEGLAGRQPIPQVRAPARAAEKQLLIARLAERRWKQWLREGRIVELGPRRFAFKVTGGGETPRARIRPRPGRGLPPREGEDVAR